MLLEISGGITPERMKGWSQSENNTQFWMEMMIEARYNGVKSSIAPFPVAICRREGFAPVCPH